MRALVLGVGGLQGAYSAGVATVLGKEVGKDYFNALYASSVGVFAGTFLVAGQPDTIERTWKDHVDGRKLINPFNLLHGKPLLNLEYLIGIFQNDVSHLDVSAVLHSKTTVFYVVTNKNTKEAAYIQPTQETIFDAMKASAALPGAYPAVHLNGGLYVDGGLSDPFPVAKAMNDGYEEVLFISNKPIGLFVGPWFDFISRTLGKEFLLYRQRIEEGERYLEQHPDVTIIRPQRELPLRSILDTNKARLEATVDIGKEDAYAFLRKFY